MSQRFKDTVMDKLELMLNFEDWDFYEMDTDWDAATGGRTTPDSDVLNICQQSARLAEEIRRQIAVARRRPGSSRIERAVRNIQTRANGQVGRLFQGIRGRMSQLNRRDIDGLVGCLARIEHAAGTPLPWMARVRSIAQQQLAR